MPGLSLFNSPPLSYFGKVQNCLRDFVGERYILDSATFFYRRKVASLSVPYSYFHDKYSDNLYSLVPPVQVFAPRIGHAITTKSNKPQSVNTLHTTRMFYSDFFSRTATLWNGLTLLWTIQSWTFQITFLPDLHNLHHSHNMGSPDGGTSNNKFPVDIVHV